jgi:uncharacterized repeat protein (TIGR03803 family)
VAILLLGIGSVHASTSDFTILHTFTGGAGGSNPYAGVIRPHNGTLYGTTLTGGSHDNGVIYKQSATGTYTVLYTFTGGADGGFPNAGVIRTHDGTLYGTTTFGGAHDNGGVYKLSAAGVYTVLYTFTGGADGGAPNAKVIRAHDGTLYGTTLLGGPSGAGVVYKLSAAGTYTVLHAFTGADGSTPNAEVIRTHDGTLYGTAAFGGANGHGVIYKLSAAGTYTVLHAFTGADGSRPYARVFRAPNGTLYGTTAFGGANNHGVVFRLSPAGVYTVLHTFTGGSDGSQPQTGVLRAPTGTLYGTTTYGGAHGFGVIYQLNTAGVYTVLHAFTGGTDDGYPFGDLLRRGSHLYGTTSGVGSAAGTIFRQGIGHGHAHDDAEDDEPEEHHHQH